MSDHLDRISASLEEVEEQLLDELAYLREELAQSSSEFAIDEGLKEAATEILENLESNMAYRAGQSDLELVSEKHEILYARIAVIRQLLNATIPADLLERAHEGILDRQGKLETRVVAQRKREGTVPVTDVRVFDHTPSLQHAARNRLHITLREEQEFEFHQSYLDIGIFSAARELAVIASLMRGGSLDRPPGEDVEEARARAVFEARELSSRPPPPVASGTPEEVRKKLQAGRREPVTLRKARFTAKDIEPASPPEFRRRPEPPKKDEPAPRPTGKAIFAAKDIEPEFPQEPPRRREKAPEKEEPVEEAPAPRPTGAAIFSARDIEPEFPQEPPRKREKPPEKVEPPPPPTGKAFFPAKDIEPEFPQEPPRKREKPPEPAEEPVPEKPTGKAFFPAKDIEPEFPQEPPRKREKPEPAKEEPPEEPRKGPAVFESRDLSTPPTKKD